MASKMVDRNPHTGEALRSKQTSDAYRDNYDAIFRKAELGVVLKELPSFGELFEVSNTPEEDFHAFNCDDGIGYYATINGYSEEHLFGKVNRPNWATHFLWFNK